MEEPDATPEADARALAAFLRGRRTLALTGAGISTESGIPDYRGPDRVGPARSPITYQQFARSERVRRRYWARGAVGWRGMSTVRPNDGHRALARLEAVGAVLGVLTQNVDGLHVDAGSRQLIEIHGNLHRLRCNDCMQGRQVPDYAGLQIPPECPRCGGTLRPDIVLFGEALPADAVERLEHVLETGLDLVVSIGTTSVFPYIAWPVLWAARQGVPTVEVNPGDTEVSRFVEYRLRMGASAALHALWYRVHPSEPAED